MTLENNRAPLLGYIKLCASFQRHGWIQTGVTVWNRSIRVKIVTFVVPCDLEIWQMTLKNNRAPFLYYIKLCAPLQSHRWIQTGVTFQKCLIWVKIDIFLALTLKFWRMTLKNNRAPLLSIIKLCVSYHHSIWIQIGVMVKNSSVGFWPLWPWPLTSDLELLKTHVHLFKATEQTEN